MIPLGRRVLISNVRRSYATATSPHALVFLEHRNGELDTSSLSAFRAATELGGQVTAFVTGNKDQVATAVEKAKKLEGLSGIVHSSSPSYETALPEVITPLLKNILSSSKYTHVVSSHGSSARGILPRVAATLDAPAISDVTSLSHDASSNSTTFTRPIYAGNAISTVRAPSTVPIKFFTVRATAFKAAGSSASGEGVTIEEISPIEPPEPAATQHISTTLAKSDRPDLNTAARVVSGGRALKSAETFSSTLSPLADALGAAVGASRAAVDAGYADNSLQVGQTGKVVAPELYMAIGISGAIQHLAGMKDSKMIVAINKDPDAPIFQVADVGLVADLYQAVPELTEKLKK
ncbi:DHS-like NAD/FAD-binding domain-containing protein [Flagelloscypha sp. PMI_526]|nr:DHS-like NAD/FAD-binding domain-containing protein [Flagelloscypha sp. PMI_526]